MENKGLKCYHLFEIYFDGINNLIEPEVGITTYQLGVTKLDYEEENNTLHIYLRRPGLLIGVRGKDYDALVKYLGCNIQIHESRLFDV